jgi:hypothetical protein
LVAALRPKELEAAGGDPAFQESRQQGRNDAKDHSEMPHSYLRFVELLAQLWPGFSLSIARATEHKAREPGFGSRSEAVIKLAAQSLLNVSTEDRASCFTARIENEKDSG